MAINDFYKYFAFSTNHWHFLEYLKNKLTEDLNNKRIYGFDTHQHLLSSK